MAVKNAPATGLLKFLVTRMVTATVAAPENAAPARFRVLPLATSASRPLAGWPAPGPGTGPGASGASAALRPLRPLRVSAVPGAEERRVHPARAGLACAPATGQPFGTGAHRLLVQHPAVTPQERVRQHGEGQRCPYGVISDHEDEGQQQDQYAGHPLGSAIAPETPRSVTEEAKIECGTDEAAANEQWPKLPVIADAPL